MSEIARGFIFWLDRLQSDTQGRSPEVVCNALDRLVWLSGSDRLSGRLSDHIPFNDNTVLPMYAIVADQRASLPIFWSCPIGEMQIDNIILSLFLCDTAEILLTWIFYRQMILDGSLNEKPTRNLRRCDLIANC